MKTDVRGTATHVHMLLKEVIWFVLNIYTKTVVHGMSGLVHMLLKAVI
jgi:hypothetical protein